MYMDFIMGEAPLSAWRISRVKQ